MNRAKIITIWGSPASGKTVCALALAAVLAEKKKNVIIFNGNKLVPHLKIFCPMAQLDGRQSIGGLLMSGRFDDTVFSQRMIIHPESEYISFIGMAPTDTYITYGDFEQQNIIQVLNRMAALSDYLIIDGLSNPIEDGMTLLGLELSDYVIRIITADTKGISYLDAARSIYSDAKYRFEEQISVLGNVREVSPVSEIMSVSGHYDHVLPYSPEVENKFIAGEHLSGFKRSPGRAFEQQIRAMAKGLE